MKDMQETKNMLKVYKSRVKMNIIFMMIFMFLVMIVAIVFLIMYPDIWWLSLVFFGMDLLFLILLFFAVKSAKKSIKKIEKELDEASSQADTCK